MLNFSSLFLGSNFLRFLRPGSSLIHIAGFGVGGGCGVGVRESVVGCAGGCEGCVGGFEGVSGGGYGGLVRSVSGRPKGF